MERMRHGARRSLCALFTAKEESSLFACGVVIFFIQMLRGSLADPCPTQCHCSEEAGVVRCHSQGIPTELPRWVRNLTITGANVTVLGAGAFGNNGTALVNLSTLVLTHNDMKVLEVQAFQGLPSLATLDLSHNALRSISPGAFRGLPQLRALRMNRALQEGAAGQLSAALLNKSSLTELELTDNQLQALPEALLELPDLRALNLRNNWLPALDVPTVAGLYRQRRLQLLLSGNPFVCDCHLKPMLFWLRNASQARDAQDLRCADPERMNTSYITRLKSDDLKCINDDLETASYVFFGIVLALIGVIFLMVLYLNRRGIKKWLNNFREACRDQMEGYHYRYEQDADARRVHFSGAVEV